MDLIFTLLVGSLIGWIASMLMRTDAQQGAIANIIVGIIGSFLGRLIFGQMLGLGGAYSAGSFSLMGIVWGIVGSAVLIAILKALHVFGGPNAHN